MTEQDLKTAASRHTWFHALDLGDFQTPGRFKQGGPQNITLFPALDLMQHIDFTGMDCLDIGTVHGLSAFGMAMRGAKSVTATDVLEEMSPPWRIAREALKLDVDYLTETTFDNILERIPDRKFDVIICTGVLYHMLKPTDAVIKCRQLLKPNGLLVLESAYMGQETRPIMELNAVTGSMKETTTYWRPSRSSMLGILRMVGLDPIAERSIDNPDRLAVLARNVPFSELRGRPEFLKKIHERGLWTNDVDVVPQGSPSSVSYSGPDDVQKLDWNSYKPNWSPHSDGSKEIVGKVK
ncbi:MAG: methyltransferase domain-containing protein [Pseudomonadota bacterium]